MNLAGIDLNLFIVFDAIYTESSLTRAGQILGITQPAASNALARLRKTLDDPLFIRTAHGMTPTPLAQNIISPVREALQLLRISVHDSRVFDPSQANKIFHLSMTDLIEDLLLPATLQRLSTSAPNLRIESLLVRRRDTAKELAAGHLDLAIDVPLNHDPQLLHTKLLEDRYVCAMRPDHPLSTQNKISLKQYLNAQHIHISSRRSGLGPVDLALGKMGHQRNIVLRSQHYLMAHTVLQSTDLTITAPARFARRHKLHFVELPVTSLAPIASHLFWHVNADQDPANRWMREQLLQVAQQISDAEPPLID